METKQSEKLNTGVFFIFIDAFIERSIYDQPTADTHNLAHQEVYFYYLGIIDKGNLAHNKREIFCLYDRKNRTLLSICNSK